MRDRVRNDDNIYFEVTKLLHDNSKLKIFVYKHIIMKRPLINVTIQTVLNNVQD